MSNIEQGITNDERRLMGIDGNPGTTGIFYHPSFSRRSYLTTGRRLAGFPGALDPLLRHPHVKLFGCPPATDEQILLAHDPALIPQVEADPL
jgi:hypothetical protein